MSTCGKGCSVLPLQVIKPTVPEYSYKTDTNSVVKGVNRVKNRTIFKVASQKHLKIDNSCLTENGSFGSGKTSHFTS